MSQNLEITGQIVDLKTQNPLSDVNIFIINDSLGTSSNNDGYFILKLNSDLQETYNLNIKLIGYEEKIIPIDLYSNIINLGIISIAPKSIQLESIDIYSNQKSSNQISDIIISGTELNQNLKGNIATTLANHPNIGINSFGSVTSKPSLRGFSGDRFLLTKEGIETGDLSQSSIDHAIALDMNEVNKIEIIRGPKSLLYGPNAIGGVINAKLLGNPKLRVDKLYHKYLIATESFNKSIYGNMMYYIPINIPINNILLNFQLNLFYSNKITENEITPIGELNNTKSITTNYKIGGTYYLNNNYINAIYENLNMEYGIPPTSIGHINGVDILMLRTSKQYNFHQNISFFNFNKIDLKYNSIDYKHVELVNIDTINYNINEVIDSILYHVFFSKKTENIKLELSSTNTIIGSEYTTKLFRPQGYYLTPTTKESQISIYGFNKLKLENFDIDVLKSFRYSYLLINPQEYNFSDRNANLILKDEDGNEVKDENGNGISLVRDRKFQNLSLSIGINKNISNFAFNNWFMYTMRAPRVEELYSDGPHLASYAFEIGNPNLKSETIYGIESSASFNSDLFNFSLIGFYNYSPYYFEMTKNGHCEVPDDWKPWTSHPCYGADWIDWGSGGLGWLHKYSAKGSRVVIKGHEIDLGYKIKNIKLNYNFSYVRGDNMSLGLPLSYMNPTKEILNIAYKRKSLNYKIRFLKIHSQNRLGEFESYTPGAIITDFILDLNYKNNKIIIQINNIFDEEYYNHLSRIKHITPEPGFGYHLVYKLFM